MNASDVIAALRLPASALVGRRVPKKLLLEHGAPTAADKRRIAEGIEEIIWVAALKPSTIGVPDYRDAERAYLEIAVLRLTLRAGAKAPRLIALVHRAVPYPLLLIAACAGQVILSAAHKRWAQNEKERTVLEGDVIAAEWDAGSDAPHLADLRDALALERQPHETMRALYQGWADALVAFKAARLTGAFQTAADPKKAAARQEALRECARLESEMNRLRAAASRERQMARLVELNMELKRMQTAYAAARAQL